MGNDPEDILWAWKYLYITVLTWKIQNLYLSISTVVDTNEFLFLVGIDYPPYNGELAQETTSDRLSSVRRSRTTTTISLLPTIDYGMLFFQTHSVGRWRWLWRSLARSVGFRWKVCLCKPVDALLSGDDPSTPGLCSPFDICIIMCRLFPNNHLRDLKPIPCCPLL